MLNAKIKKKYYNKSSEFLYYKSLEIYFLYVFYIYVFFLHQEDPKMSKFLTLEYIRITDEGKV